MVTYLISTVMTSIPNPASAPSSSSIWTIVVAAGSGSRFGGAIPKQFVQIAGRSVLMWSLHHAAAMSDGIVVVLPADIEADDEPPNVVSQTPVIRATGGASRSASVRAGLAQVPDDASVVLVHDAARPVASSELFRRVAHAVSQGADAATPSVAVIDTIKTVDGGHVDRSTLRAVQTPQGFAADVLRMVHAAGEHATDDATLVARAGRRVVDVEGERWNIKLTEPADEAVIAGLVTRSGQTAPMHASPTHRDGSP